MWTKKIFLVVAGSLVVSGVTGCGVEEEPGEVASTWTASWSSEVWSGIASGEYGLRRSGSGYSLTNRAQGLRGWFDERGLRVEDQEGAGEVRVELSGWGRAGLVEATRGEEARLGECASDGAVDAMGSCLRRLEYARGGVVEWWENRPEGLEQGFTVTKRPAGAGPLVFDVSVSGARVEVEGGTATLVRGGGAPLSYGGLRAWDETGLELPSRMEWRSGGLRLVVEDAGAQGTVTVDPVLAANPSWRAEGNQAGALMQAVASAGDVNGDGYGDVVVGAPGYTNSQFQEGAAFLYLGSATGLSTTASWTVGSNQAESGFGQRVSSAGDVNGDGYGDVVVGALRYDNGETDEGAAFLYLGSAAGLSTTASWTAESNQANAYFGEPVSSAGDVNGDGYGDVVVGASLFDKVETDEGAAFLYLGSAAGLSTTASWTGESNQTGAGYATSASSAGDVNGDGYGDVVVGARRYDNGETNEGAAFVYLGSAAGLSTTASWMGESNQVDGGFGSSVASAGDVNGDGYGDVVAGAHTFGNGETGEGAAFVYLGSAAGLSTTASWTAEGNQAEAAFGNSVSSAGDVNGDGYGDVVVGAAGFNDDAGAAFAYLGSAAGLSTVPSWTALGSVADHYFGIYVASAGDVDDDGCSEVMVAEVFFSDDFSQPSEGAAHVFYDLCPVATGDTGLPAATGETGATGDSEGTAPETGAPIGDSGADETDDPAEAPDGSPGSGCGCASPGAGPGGALLVVGVALGVRRRRAA
jgi:uncharacterized protein (TIGR03382 family)